MTTGTDHQRAEKLAINLNADLGEGFGPYRLGDDEALLDVVRSANVACGFHAGDPDIMRRTCEWAKAKGVSLGAHPGYDDRAGFGRRDIGLSAVQVENLVAYQTGALMGAAALSGARVSHVKPHGALYNRAVNDPDLAAALARAIKAVDPRLIFLCLAGSAMEQAGLEAGLAVAREAFVDRAYQDNGQLAPRSQAGSVLHDAKQATSRAVELVLTGGIASLSGKRIPLKVDSLCVHGDSPDALAMARTCRAGLEAAGIGVETLPDLLGERASVQ